MTRLTVTALSLSFLFGSLGRAQPGVIANGWRGNGTGLWPEAQPPLEWHRIPLGVASDLRVRAAKPDGKSAASDARLEKGIVPEWLVLSPRRCQRC
jgi:hypothetical protein